jgi:hypothetical protein
MTENEAGEIRALSSSLRVGGYIIFQASFCTFWARLFEVFKKTGMTWAEKDFEQWKSMNQEVIDWRACMTEKEIELVAEVDFLCEGLVGGI